MDIDFKYIVFNFLDKGEFEDYFLAVKMVSQTYKLSLDEAEYYVRTWYPEQSWIDYETFYNMTKKIAEMYTKDLNTYRTYDEFWNDVIPSLDDRSIEFLLLFPPNFWIMRGIQGHLIKRKNELKDAC